MKILTFDNENDIAKELHVHFANVGKSTFEKTQNIIHGGNVLNIDSVNANSNTGNVDNEYVFRPHPVDTETIILTLKV